jgi:hypothetical protein
MFSLNQCRTPSIYDFFETEREIAIVVRLDQHMGHSAVCANCYAVVSAGILGKKVATEVVKNGSPIGTRDGHWGGIRRQITAERGVPARVSPCGTQ